MAMSNYKIKRLICFLLCSIVGTLSCFGLLLFGFPMLGVLLFGAIISVIAGLVGYIITGFNPWIKAVQGDALLVVDVNSTGVGKFYNAKVINNPLGGIDLSIDFGDGQQERRVYDRKITHRMLSPQKIFMFPWNRVKSKPQVVPVEKKSSTDEKIDKLLDFLIQKENGGKL